MEEGDLDRVLEIERASFPSPWQREHFCHELHERPRAVSLVLERAGRIAGYACARALFEDLEISNLAVDPAGRGSGLGGRLLRRLLAEGRRRGCHRATLEVRPGNRRALALYRAHGFRETGWRRAYYGDTGEDAVLMEAPIGPRGPRRRRCPGAAGEV